MILRTTATAALIALLATSCGGSSADADDDAGPNIVVQGENALDIEEVVTTTTEAETLDAAGGAAEGGGEDGDEPADEEAPEPEDTIPQNDDDGDEIDNIFSAMSIFNNCLKDEGREFIGIPGAEETEADDPVNDPAYIEVLVQCAAVSQIQEAFTALDTASNNLTQDEILERNRGLVVWKDCMVGRGWTISDLEPDDNGLLSPGIPEAPEGENILESDDLKECTDIARAQVAEEDEAA